MPWTRKRVRPSFAASSSKTRMNSSPIALRFSSGSVDAGELREEPLLGVDVHERHVEVALEGLDDLERLVLAQQPVVDEDARELVADRLVDEQRGDRGVDAAGEAADHALAADLGADALDLLLDHRGGRPGGRRAGDLVEEVLQQVLAVRRVHDLGVELDAVELAPRLLEGGDRRRRRAGDDARALGRRRDRVAVAHPDRLLGGQVAEERARGVGLDLGLAELGDAGALDAAAELERHQLHAVADAEHRDAELEELGVDLRRAVGVHRGRAAGEDQRVRPPRAHRVGRDRVRDELRVDAASRTRRAISCEYWPPQSTTSTGRSSGSAGLAADAATSALSGGNSAPPS